MDPRPQRSFYVNLRLLLSCTHGKDKGQRQCICRLRVVHSGVRVCVLFVVSISYKHVNNFQLIAQIRFGLDFYCIAQGAACITNFDSSYVFFSFSLFALLFSICNKSVNWRINKVENATTLKLQKSSKGWKYLHTYMLVCAYGYSDMMGAAGCQLSTCNLASLNPYWEYTMRNSNFYAKQLA